MSIINQLTIIYTDLTHKQGTSRSALFSILTETPQVAQLMNYVSMNVLYHQPWNMKMVCIFPMINRPFQNSIRTYFMGRTSAIRYSRRIVLSQIFPGIYIYNISGIGILCNINDGDNTNIVVEFTGEYIVFLRMLIVEKVQALVIGSE